MLGCQLGGTQGAYSWYLSGCLVKYLTEWSIETISCPYSAHRRLTLVV
nr:MAG TPA: hypothetical protein [Caudoviricetes sp.]